VNGVSRKRTPVASKKAFAIAGPTLTIDSSPARLGDPAREWRRLDEEQGAR
jgi:hypothetical protein